MAEEDNNFSLADAFEAQLKGEEPKKEETPAEEPKPEEKVTPPAEPAKVEPKKEEEAKPPAEEKKPAEPPKVPETPPTPAPEEPATPQPLTKEDVAEAINKVREEERTSGQVIETATEEVMKAYYPEGLSEVLVDSKSGKELRTPQDVVDASGGSMSVEQAKDWLIDKQHELQSNIAEIKKEARGIAEQTVKFKEGVADVLIRYEGVFKAYPGVQKKVWDQFSKMVKADEAKNVILSAPDIREFYDTVLEPYQKAYEYAQKNPSATPTPATPAAPATPPATPTADDRLDEGGDGGQSEVDDPNDFAQQVRKELSKERR